MVDKIVFLVVVMGVPAMVRDAVRAVRNRRDRLAAHHVEDGNEAHPAAAER